MTAKVVHLQVRGGIQRDGTNFRSPYYVDGQWVRFQVGKPRKIGGYKGIFLNASGISRGMTMTTLQGLNYVISGYQSGLERWTTDRDDGVGAGPTQLQFQGPLAALTITTAGSGLTTGVYTNVPLTGGSGSGATANITVSSGVVISVTVATAGTGYITADTLSAAVTNIGGTGTAPTFTVSQTGYFTPSAYNLWQLDIGYDAYGAGQYQLIAHPGLNLTDITNLANTRPLVGSYTGTTMTAVGVFQQAATLTSGSTNITFASTIAAVGAGVSVSGTGIPAGTTVVSVNVVSGTFTATLSAAATASGTYTLTFDNNIEVSGGAVMLYPYLFVYGNYGYIANCAAGDFNNWTSSDSNKNNVASTKIVKGMPLRGGNSAPAGLFWSLDSVIRVTYTPTSVGGLTYYWNYDIISTQSSIMSAQSVIEYDGIFYWVGVDRFLMYNGVVQEVPNTQNLNWFFDNVNFAAREKVWACKVPRWGEIWFFYPRGTATECTDAIIYNVREQIWYDAGSAPGAARSAGVFAEVFIKPIMAGNVANSTGKYTLWQHETGTDQVYGNNVDAINSFVETPAIGNLGGLIGSTQQLQEPWMPVIPPDGNLWTRVERVEPDFLQQGTMSLYIVGKGYANDTEQVSAPYEFDSSTLKISMREQRRELRLRFVSNTVGGDYYMGRILLSMDVGDVRGTALP